MPHCVSVIALLLSVTLLVAAAATSKCTNKLVQSCTLQPYGVTLKDQAFCASKANEAEGERQGTGCSSLKYCCSTVSDFGNSRNMLRLADSRSFSLDKTTGAVVINSGRSIKIDFAKEACVGSIDFVTKKAGSIRVARTYSRSINGGAISEASESSPSTGESTMVINECRVIALVITAPASGYAIIESISTCLLDTKLDKCGVCNGKDQCNITREDVSGAAPQVSSKKRDDPVMTPTAQTSSSSSIMYWIPSAIEETDVSIQPTLNCTYLIPHSDYCFSLFGYDYPTVKYNSSVFVIDSSLEQDNTILPGPTYRGQPTAFYPGTHTSAFGTVWLCRKYHERFLTWRVRTDTENNGLVQQRAFSSRAVSTCPQSVIDYWLC